MPAVIAPSPITATARCADPVWWKASAMPSAAEIEVLEWPAPKASYSLSARRGKPAMPPPWRRPVIAARRPVRILCG